MAKSIPNCRKIWQHLILHDPPIVYPNWDFWFENMPSGNPDFGSCLLCYSGSGWDAAVFEDQGDRIGVWYGKFLLKLQMQPTFLGGFFHG
jgi:hypothetical protein